MIKTFTLKIKFPKESENLKKLHSQQKNWEHLKITDSVTLILIISSFNFVIEDNKFTLKKPVVKFSVRALIPFLFNNLLGEASISTKTRDRLF